MNRATAVSIACLALAIPLPANEALAGDWLGTINAGVTLRVAFHVKAAPDGKLTATLDSLDQGARGIPVGSITLTEGSVRIEVPVVAGSFAGRLSEKRDTIEGTWSQAGMEKPLVLRRLTAAEAAALEPKRPQIPKKPYPYEEQEVTVPNKAAPEVRLACTLTVPRGAGPFPAVATITGSGAQTRDEDVMGHPVFLVVADHLTRNGIAVLRCDDRGTGKSTGDHKSATILDFSTDAEAAIEYLKTAAKIDPKRIGLLGHSEGGTIAPIAAGRRSEVAFVVLLAPTAVSGRQIVKSQRAAITRAAGMPVPDDTGFDKLFDALLAGKEEATLNELAAALLPPGAPPAAAAGMLSMMNTPWFRHVLAYDPAPALAKLTMPVLALFGEKDLQVLPSVNEAPLRAALAMNKRARIEVLPGLNHLFQASQTGLPQEYGTIEETFSPAVLKLVSDWILQVTK